MNFCPIKQNAKEVNISTDEILSFMRYLQTGLICVIPSLGKAIHWSKSQGGQCRGYLKVFNPRNMHTQDMNSSICLSLK